MGITGYLIHPDREFAQSFESIAVFQHAAEHFLHQVFTNTGIAG